MPTLNDVEAAQIEYERRKRRETNPDGSFDKGGRWRPSVDEWRPCCECIRAPTRRFPYSLMVHCRTRYHVAALYGVAPQDIKKMPAKQPQREGGDHYYKLVAKVDGRFLSIYDGETAYELGKTLNQNPRQDHGGGFYVYPSQYAAKRAMFPTNSALLSKPKVMLRMRCEGAYCRYENDKLAFARVTPIEEVDMNFVNKWQD